MKRILFISQYLNRAGTEAFMMNVFRGIDHHRFQADFLLYSWQPTDYSREVEAAGGRVWRVPCRRESVWGWYRSLNAFFKEHAADYSVIHYCGNGLTAIAPIYFAYRYGVPVRISHSHNSSSEGLHNRVLHLLQRGLAKKMTTHHFACSSQAAKWFFGSSPAVIVNNGIDTVKFSFNAAARERVRTALHIDRNTTVIGHVGRFEPEKNHAFMLDIFSAYLAKNPNAMLMLVGVGRLHDATRQKAREMGIDAKVRFMGERSDVDQLMQAMDLFLMPSTFEGQPFVLIEAQCEGLPCLVSDAINDDICLTHNIEKFALKRGAAAWADEMEAMLSNYRRRSEHKMIEEKGYSLAQTIAYLEKVYDGKIL